MASQKGASAGSAGRLSVKRAPTGKEIEEAIQRASLAEVVASSGRSTSASRAVSAMELSDRLVTLRDQLEQSSAYVNWKHLEEMRVLGGGASATVTKCYYKPPGAKGQIVAVKQVGVPGMAGISQTLLPCCWTQVVKPALASQRVPLWLCTSPGLENSAGGGDKHSARSCALHADED